MISKICIVIKLGVALILTVIAFITLSPFVFIQGFLSVFIMIFGFFNNVNIEISTKIYNFQVNLITGLLSGVSF